MAFAGFGKKREATVPADAVISMQQQGYSNDQIIQNLQSQGFSQDQINTALSQAEIKQGVTAQPQPQPMPQQPPEQQPEGMPPPMSAEGVVSGDVERIEEIAEAIVEEKWKELIKSVDKMNEWKSQAEQKLSSIEESLSTLREDFDKLHTAILGKIGEYDQNIVNLSAEIKAKEKVLQKRLPTFTENVNELSRITKTLKGVKPK